MNPLDKNIFLKQLVSHDGITDSLTGLMTFQLFQRSAIRELAQMMRNKGSINLFLVSLAEESAIEPNKLLIQPNQDVSALDENEIVTIADRVLQSSNTLKNEFRLNDLVARYTFADFLILNLGDFDVISIKVRKIAKRLSALSVGMRIEHADLINFPSEHQQLSETIHKSIASLERQIVE